MADIENALSKGHGNSVTVRCRGHSLNEIWYHFHVAGALQTGDFVSSSPGLSHFLLLHIQNMLLKMNLDGLKSNCPARGVRYQPKKAHEPQPTTTTTFTTTHAPKPTEPGIPFNGMGNLKVSTQGQGRGCIISHGTWFSSGTCATFKAEKVRGLYSSLPKHKYIHKPHESNQFLYLQRTHFP